MKKLIIAARQALDALSDFDYNKRMKAITALREALAEPDDAPVAYCRVRPLRGDEMFPKSVVEWVNGKPIPGPLYDRPQPAAQWVGLTDEEIHGIWSSGPDLMTLARSIEAKLKEKNT